MVIGTGTAFGLVDLCTYMQKKCVRSWLSYHRMIYQTLSILVFSIFIVVVFTQRLPEPNSISDCRHLGLSVKADNCSKSEDLYIRAYLTTQSHQTQDGAVNIVNITKQHHYYIS